MARNPIRNNLRLSTTRPILFNTDINDLFFTVEDCDIPNYTDDNKPYLSRKNVEEDLNSLQWFTNNTLKGNASRCHFLISSDKKVDVNINTSEKQQL